MNFNAAHEMGKKKKKQKSRTVVLVSVECHPNAYANPMRAIRTGMYE